MTVDPSAEVQPGILKPRTAATEWK